MFSTYLDPLLKCDKQSGVYFNYFKRRRGRLKERREIWIWIGKRDLKRSGVEQEKKIVVDVYCNYLLALCVWVCAHLNLCLFRWEKQNKKMPSWRAVFLLRPKCHWLSYPPPPPRLRERKRERERQEPRKHHVRVPWPFLLLLPGSFSSYSSLLLTFSYSPSPPVPPPPPASRGRVPPR